MGSQYVGAGQRGDLNPCQPHNGPLIHPALAMAVQSEGSGLGQGQHCPPSTPSCELLVRTQGPVPSPNLGASLGDCQGPGPGQYPPSLALDSERKDGSCSQWICWGSTVWCQDSWGRCHLKGSGVDERMLSESPVPPVAVPIFSSYKLINLCVLKIYLFYIDGCFTGRFVHHMYAVPEEARRGRQIPLQLEL